ncbi:hypothetical protein J6590_093426 [Homalodisca vitripennis]|nr:hypothetical protein J6590_089771 [Homalodisca vitripennis]KAG8294860.1 hypothetical protein J6590_093426 [Homalodisca vitripennis]
MSEGSIVGGPARSRRVETPAPDYLITTVRSTRATLHIPVWYHQQPDCGDGRPRGRDQLLANVKVTVMVRHSQTPPRHGYFCPNCALALHSSS